MPCHTVPCHAMPCNACLIRHIFQTSVSLARHQSLKHNSTPFLNAALVDQIAHRIQAVAGKGRKKKTEKPLKLQAVTRPWHVSAPAAKLDPSHQRKINRCPSPCRCSLFGGLVQARVIVLIEGTCVMSWLSVANYSCRVDNHGPSEL